MGLWAKSLLVFQRLCDSGPHRVRRLAHKPGLAKSRVQRLRQARARRGGSPASWWWAPADGRRWRTRCVVATLSSFGRTRGGGLATRSAFFVRLRRESQRGRAPTA